MPWSSLPVKFLARARDAHRIGPQARAARWKLGCRGLLACNFRPVSTQLSSPYGALDRKRVHCMCTRARNARIRRRCQVMLLAEQLVGEARARRARSMDAREHIVVAAFAALYCVAAVAIALLVPS